MSQKESQTKDVEYEYFDRLAKANQYLRDRKRQREEEKKDDDVVLLEHPSKKAKRDKLQQEMKSCRLTAITTATVQAPIIPCLSRSRLLNFSTDEPSVGFLRVSFTMNSALAFAIDRCYIYHDSLVRIFYPLHQYPFVLHTYLNLDAFANNEVHFLFQRRADPCEKTEEQVEEEKDICIAERRFGALLKRKRTHVTVTSFTLKVPSLTLKSSGDCTICLESCSSPKQTTVTPYGHSFHNKCLADYLGHQNVLRNHILEANQEFKCPVCRASVSLYKCESSSSSCYLKVFLFLLPVQP
jgi:hypothetical protein